MKAKLSVLALAAAGAAGMVAGTSLEAATILQVLPVQVVALDHVSLVSTNNQDNLSYDNSLGTVVGDETENAGLGFTFPTARVGYFDLGENWENLRIYETWTFARNNAPTPTSTPTGFTDVWWSNNPTSKVFDAGDGDVNEATLNFALNGATGFTKKTWMTDIKLDDSTAITPQGRYFKFRTPVANDGSFSEIAFVGVVVPEPASLSILGLGGLALLARRRRQA